MRGLTPGDRPCGAATQAKGHKASGDRPGEAATVAEAKQRKPTAVQGPTSGFRARGGRQKPRGKGPPPSFTALPTSLASSSGDNAVEGSGGGWRQFSLISNMVKARGHFGFASRYFSSFKRPELAPVVTSGSSILPPSTKPVGGPLKPRIRNILFS